MATLNIQNSATRISEMDSEGNVRNTTSPLVFVIPGVVTGTILVICIIVTLCVCARYRGWCPRIFRTRRTRQPQKQEIERIKAKIIDQYKRRKRKSRKNDVIPDVIDSTLICAICLDGYVSTISKRHRMLAQLTQCSHHFHFNCIFQWLDRNPSCPVCRTPIALSDDKIKAIGLQDVCCLDKPLDLMPPVTDHDVIIMTPTAETSTSVFVPSSGTPSPRLMAAYLLSSNQDSPSAPSVGTGSTFSTMSSVKSSDTLDRTRVHTLPNPVSTDPQPSTSTSPQLETLNVANLPKLVTPPLPTNSAITPPPQVSLPRTPSQMVVNVEINALASSFYHDVSSSESSQSDDTSRHSSTSSSSFDSAHDIWPPDCRSSIIRPNLDSSLDNYRSTTNIVRDSSSSSRSAGGLDNPAFEQDFDETSQRQLDLPKVHGLNASSVNCSVNCDTMIEFSIIDENPQQRNSVPECQMFCNDATSSNGARLTNTGSLHDMRTVNSVKADGKCRNSIAEIQISERANEQSSGSCTGTENVSNRNVTGRCDSVSRQGLPNIDSGIAQIILNKQHSDDNYHHTQYSELPSTSVNSANENYQDISHRGGNVPVGARRTKSTGAHDYTQRRDTRPHSVEGSPNTDSSGRPRVNSYSHTAKANVHYKRNQHGSLRRDQDEYTATLNDIYWSNRPGSSRYVPKPRQHVRRTPSVNERHTTSSPARTLPSRTPPSVLERPEDRLHSSGSMPDFNRPCRNGRMWQSLSSSLSALSETGLTDPPLTSTYM